MALLWSSTGTPGSDSAATVMPPGRSVMVMVATTPQPRRRALPLAPNVPAGTAGPSRRTRSTTLEPHARVADFANLRRAGFRGDGVLWVPLFNSSILRGRDLIDRTAQRGRRLRTLPVGCR